MPPQTWSTPKVRHHLRLLEHVARRSQCVLHRGGSSMERCHLVHHQHGARPLVGVVYVASNMELAQGDPQYAPPPTRRSPSWTIVQVASDMGLAQGWAVPTLSPPRSPSMAGHHLHLCQCRSHLRWGVVDTNLIEARLHLHLHRQACLKRGTIYTILNMELTPGGVSSTPSPRRRSIYTVADTEPTPRWGSIYFVADTSHRRVPFALTLDLTRPLVTPTL